MKRKYKTRISHVMESHYCKAVFAASLIISFFLMPNNVFHGWQSMLAIAFMVTFSLTLTCLVRNIKERVKAAKESSANHSIASLIAIAIGLGAIQMCGLGNVCAASIGITFLSLALPNTAMLFLHEISIYIIILSVLIQIYVLRKTGCFRRVA